MMALWLLILVAQASPGCPVQHLAHGLATAPDPAALELLLRAQDGDWRLFLHRTEARSCGRPPELPSRRRLRALSGSPEEPGPSAATVGHELLGWGRPSPSPGRITRRRLLAAREALCAAPALAPAPSCGGATVHAVPPATWPEAPPWLVRIDRPDAHLATLHLRLPLGAAGPQPTAVAAHRLALAFSGPLHRALREEGGLVYDLGADIVVAPGASALVLRLRLPAAQVPQALRLTEAVRRRLESDPVGTLGGIPALQGSARALALQATIERATAEGRGQQELVAFVSQGDPLAPGWHDMRWSEEELQAGALALASAPWTWLLEGDAARLDPALAAQGIRPALLRPAPAREGGRVP